MGLMRIFTRLLPQSGEEHVPSRSEGTIAMPFIIASTLCVGARPETLMEFIIVPILWRHMDLVIVPTLSVGTQPATQMESP